MDQELCRSSRRGERFLLPPGPRRAQGPCVCLGEKEARLRPVLTETEGAFISRSVGPVVVPPTPLSTCPFLSRSRSQAQPVECIAPPGWELARTAVAEHHPGWLRHPGVSSLLGLGQGVGRAVRGRLSWTLSATSWWLSMSLCLFTRLPYLFLCPNAPFV